MSGQFFPSDPGRRNVSGRRPEDVHSQGSGAIEMAPDPWLSSQLCAAKANELYLRSSLRKNIPALGKQPFAPTVERLVREDFLGCKALR